MKRAFIAGATGSLARYVIEALQHLDDVKLTLLYGIKQDLLKTWRGVVALLKGDF